MIFPTVLNSLPLKWQVVLQRPLEVIFIYPITNRHTVTCVKFIGTIREGFETSSGWYAISGSVVMNERTGIEQLLARDRLIISVAMLAIFLIAAVYTVMGVGMSMS